MLVDEVNSPRIVVLSQQLADMLKPCADKISIKILNAIESANKLNIHSTGPYLRNELGIGKKQLYSRVQRLMQQGSIRHGGHESYVLTTFGNIIIGNVITLINTCIQSATELELKDSIINANTKPTKFQVDNTPELVKNLLTTPC